MNDIDKKMEHTERVVGLISKTQDQLKDCTVGEVFDVGLFLMCHVAVQTSMSADEFIARCVEGRAAALKIRSGQPRAKGAAVVKRIYIAGAWVEQHTRARPMMAAVRKAGLTVTHDSTVPEGEICMCGEHVRDHIIKPPGGRPGGCRMCPCAAFNGIGVGSDSNLTIEYRLTHSELELAAVESAEIVWHLAPNAQGSAGSWVELGAALMARRLRKVATDGTSGLPRIVVSGPKNRRTLFTERADVLLSTDAEALQFIVTMAQAASAR